MSYKKMKVDQVQGAAITIEVPDDKNFRADRIGETNHQLTVEPVLATTGTVAISIQVWGATEFRPLLDPVSQTQVVMSLADTDTVSFTGHVTAFKFTPAGVDDTFNIACSGW